MQWFWSPSKEGFFNDEDNVPTCANPVPVDAVSITEQEHQDLLTGQCLGKLIVTGPDGTPILQDR